MLSSRTHVFTSEAIGKALPSGALKLIHIRASCTPMRNPRWRNHVDIVILGKKATTALRTVYAMTPSASRSTYTDRHLYCLPLYFMPFSSSVWDVHDNTLAECVYVFFFSRPQLHGLIPCAQCASVMRVISYHTQAHPRRKFRCFSWHAGWL